MQRQINSVVAAVEKKLQLFAAGFLCICFINPQRNSFPGPLFYLLPWENLSRRLWCEHPPFSKCRRGGGWHPKESHGVDGGGRSERQLDTQRGTKVEKFAKFSRSLGTLCETVP